MEVEGGFQQPGTRSRIGGLPTFEPSEASISSSSVQIYESHLPSPLLFYHQPPSTLNAFLPTPSINQTTRTSASRVLRPFPPSFPLRLLSSPSKLPFIMTTHFKAFSLPVLLALLALLPSTLAADADVPLNDDGTPKRNILGFIPSIPLAVITAGVYLVIALCLVARWFPYRLGMMWWLVSFGLSFRARRERKLIDLRPPLFRAFVLLRSEDASPMQVGWL